MRRAFGPKERRGLFADAIDVALSQAGVSIEVVVVNDGSTDGTHDRVAAYRDPRVTLIDMPVNGGVSKARNAGLLASRGRWIASLDSDDKMLPGRIAQLVSVADQMHLDMIADNMIVESIDGKEYLHFKEDLDESVEMLNLEILFKEASTHKGGKDYGYVKPLFRRSFIEQHRLAYDPTLRVVHDFQLLADCLACGAKFGRIRIAKYIYQRRAGSVSHRLRLDDFSDEANAYLHFLERFKSTLTPGERAAIQERIDYLHMAKVFAVTMDHLKRRQFLKAARALSTRPAAVSMFGSVLKFHWKRLRQA